MFQTFIENSNGQISSLIPSDRLPSSWQDWQQAGSSVLTGGITIDECIIATEYGIIADGVTDNSSVLNALIANSSLSGYTIIYFPSGAYMFNEQITINKQKIILKGAGGADAPAQTHFHFNLSSGTNSCISISNNYNGIEDIYFIQEQLDGSISDPENYHTNTITISGSNCWIRGVESVRTRRFHVELSGEYNTVSGCYFHDGENYSDDGGRAYGVCISGGKRNLVENNIFYHLRHSMVLQYDAQLNVLGYNYSSLPHGFNGGYNSTIGWSSRLPDLCLHGQAPGPSGNLCEGNWIEKIGIDDEHGTNGSHNTFFRDLAEDNYNEFMDGFFIQFHDVDESIQSNQNVVGCNAKPSVSDWNKIHDYGFFVCWYLHSIWGLEEQWQYTPSDQYSYYKTTIPDFWYSWISWPYYPDGENPAKSRCWMADNNYPDATKPVYVGWDQSFYTNMCGPCTFVSKEITQSPVLQNNFQSIDYIKASCSISITEPITLVASDYIELNPNFETLSGSEFEASIEEINCPNSGSKILQIQPYSTSNIELQNEITITDSSYFNLFPNPTNGEVSVNYHFPLQGTVLFKLYNYTGVEEYSKILPAINNNSTLSLGFLSDGIYFYRVYLNNKQIAADKIIIIK